MPSRASRPNSSATGAFFSSASAGGGPKSTAKPECCCGGPVWAGLCGAGSCGAGLCGAGSGGAGSCGAGALARLCLRPFATLFYACLTGGSSSTESMHRLSARFLLMFAFVGTFLPLASVATAAPPHACCIRKAAHQCHGSLGDGNELTVRSTGCCSHDCCRGVRTSQSAHPQLSLPSIFALHTDICIAQPPANAPTTQL